MVINKFILAALITVPNFLLCGQDKLIKITPLHEPNVSKEVRDKIEAERLQQQNQVVGQSSENNLIIEKDNTEEVGEQVLSAQKNINTTNARQLIMPAEWILESSMNNAPKLVQGIFSYLKSQQFMSIPSFHRFILVGPPGTGKTTLAYAIAHMLGCTIDFISATSLLGHFRNQTSENIRSFLKHCTSDGRRRVIIIDELHKLFEQHSEARTDDSQNAATFWLALDSIEKYNPNVIIIGTANNVEKLPSEIKSRFSGKIITMPLLDNNQKVQTFKNSIAHDQSVVIDSSVDDAFIIRMLQHMKDCSLRDVQLLIDSAKMFNYAQQSVGITQLPIVLTRTNFQQALNQLQAELQVLQESTLENFYKKISKWGVVISVAANIAMLIRTSSELLQKSSNGLSK